jgi:hypothetical protein
MPGEESKTLTWGTVLKGVVVVLGLLLTLWALQSHLEGIIRSIVNNEEFITKVASHVRPYVIFDACGTIHVDGGAMQYLEKIEVEKAGTVRKAGEQESHIDELKIIVTPKFHLTYAPLVEALGELRSIIIYDPKRGVGHQWIYQALIRPPHGGDIKTQKFRLEVLR